MDKISYFVSFSMLIAKSPKKVRKMGLSCGLDDQALQGMV